MELTQSARDKLVKFSESSSFGVGLEYASFSLSFRYLHEQVVFALQLDSSRLASRCSSLSSIGILYDYISMFSKEAVACDIDTFTYIITDYCKNLSSDSKSAILSHQFSNTIDSSSLVEVFKLVDSLRHIYDSQQQIKHQLRRESSSQSMTRNFDSYDLSLSKGDSHDQVSVLNKVYSSDSLKLKNGESETIVEALSRSRSESHASSSSLSIESYLKQKPVDRSPSDHEYEGFQLISADVYVRNGNPYLIVNEIAAYKFSRLKNKLWIKECTDDSFNSIIPV